MLDLKDPKFSLNNKLMQQQIQSKGILILLHVDGDEDTLICWKFSFSIDLGEEEEKKTTKLPWTLGRIVPISFISDISGEFFNPIFQTIK